MSLTVTSSGHQLTSTSSFNWEQPDLICNHLKIEVLKYFKNNDCTRVFDTLSTGNIIQNKITILNAEPTLKKVYYQALKSLIQFAEPCIFIVKDRHVMSENSTLLPCIYLTTIPKETIYNADGHPVKFPFNGKNVLLVSEKAMNVLESSVEI